MGPTGSPGEDGQRVSTCCFCFTKTLINNKQIALNLEEPLQSAPLAVVRQLSPQAAAAGRRLLTWKEEGLCLTFPPYETNYPTITSTSTPRQLLHSIILVRLRISVT